MKEETIAVTLETVVGEAMNMKNRGYRFVTMSGVELDEKDMDVCYHFDKDLELKHFRLTVPKRSTIPSISGVYFGAFLIENELQDQFSLKFDGLVLDFGGTLYFEDDFKNRTPLCRYSVKQAGE